MPCVLVLILAGLLIVGLSGTAIGMKPLPRPAGTHNPVVSPDGSLGKGIPSGFGATTQLAAVGRRMAIAPDLLRRVHVSGIRPVAVPPDAIDALADWRDGEAPDAELWWDSNTRIPIRIQGRDLTLRSATPVVAAGTSAEMSAALATFQQVRGLLGLREPARELRVLSEKRDGLGMTHVRFQQTFRGHDVWARDSYAHFASDSRLTAINGRWVPTPSHLDRTAPVLSASAAVDVVKSRFPARDPIQVADTALLVYIDTNQQPHWAWRVRTSLSRVEAYDVFIDAVTGEHLHDLSLVYSDGPYSGSGTDLFGTTRVVNAYRIGSTYYMINATKPMFDMVHSQIPNTVKGGIEIDNYHSPNPNWVTTTNPSAWGNPAAVSAAFHLGLIYDYYLSTHNRSSLDNQGSTLKAIVNDPLPEADGNNAYYSFLTQTMTFGTGDGVRFTNLARSLDVTAHEMTHGVTDATAGLQYEFQSGALSESFSDIFGTMAEFYVYGGSANWLIGEDAYTPATLGDALRDMSNPHNGGSPQPANMSEYEYLPMTTDNGGVHRNSGIPNRAFYLTAAAVGRGKADSIFYRALTTQLNQYSQFLDLRLALVQSASELYPGDTATANSIRSAFDQVQIYDGSWSEPPETEPVPTSAQWIVAKSGLAGRVAIFDTAGSFLRYVSQARTLTKPTVADSGELIYFIDTMSMIRVVDPEGTLEVQLGDSSLKFANIAISPDGHHMACDLQWDPTIYILHLGHSEPITMLPLYTPTNSEVKSYDVLYPDVIEWDIYGKDIIYDCYCETPQPSGTLRYWDIRNLEVSTGLIQRTVPSIPLGWTIGNPSFGKIHPDLIALDFAYDDGSIYLYAADRRSNRVTEVAPNGTSLNRPTFSPDDSRILVQYDGGAGLNLWRAGFNSNTLTITTDWDRIIDSASYPNWRFSGREFLTDVENPDQANAIPSAFSLYQNYPNPFNSSTVIRFVTKTWRPTTLEIFNVLGQRVFEQEQDAQPPGQHAIVWNGQGESGQAVPSGLYLYRVTADGEKQMRKMVVLR